MKKINASELKSYLNYGFKIEEIKGNFLRIETSFLDNMNDFIDLYLVQEKNRIIITDDGFLLYDIETFMGDIIDFRTETDKILKFNSVKIVDHELIVEVKNLNRVGESIARLLRAYYLIVGLMHDQNK